jgi:hypothetical protein
LGYKENNIHFMQSCDDVFRYIPSCMVHRDTIEWTIVKDKILEEIAVANYFDQSKAGNLFATIEMLVESDDLPALGNKLNWTQFLLADILNKKDCFVVFGYNQNAYVPIPNDQNIECFEDIVSRFLEKEFDGASNLDSFSEYLIKLGLTKNGLKPSMLLNGKAVIRGKEVLIKELLNNA